MRKVAKAVIAFVATTVGALGTWVGTLAPGPITGREWATLGVALGTIIITTFGVYQTKNEPAA